MFYVGLFCLPDFCCPKYLACAVRVLLTPPGLQPALALYEHTVAGRVATYARAAMVAAGPDVEPDSESVSARVGFNAPAPRGGGAPSAITPSPAPAPAAAPAPVAGPSHAVASCSRLVDSRAAEARARVERVLVQEARDHDHCVLCMQRHMAIKDPARYVRTRSEEARQLDRWMAHVVQRHCCYIAAVTVQCHVRARHWRQEQRARAGHPESVAAADVEGEVGASDSPAVAVADEGEEARAAGEVVMVDRLSAVKRQQTSFLRAHLRDLRALRESGRAETFTLFGELAPMLQKRIRMQRRRLQDIRQREPASSGTRQQMLATVSTVQSEVLTLEETLREMNLSVSVCVWPKEEPADRPRVGSASLRVHTRLLRLTAPESRVGATMAGGRGARHASYRLCDHIYNGSVTARVPTSLLTLRRPPPPRVCVRVWHVWQVVDFLLLPARHRRELLEDDAHVPIWRKLVAYQKGYQARCMGAVWNVATFAWPLVRARCIRAARTHGAHMLIPRVHAHYMIHMRTIHA